LRLESVVDLPVGGSIIAWRRFVASESRIQVLDAQNPVAIRYRDKTLMKNETLIWVGVPCLNW
jgi:hypothetical protein